MRRVRARRRCALQHLDGDVGAGAAAASAIVPGEPRELLVELLLGVEAPVDREPGRARHDVEARARARGARRRRASTLAARSQELLLDSSGASAVSGSAIRIMLLERVHAEMCLADVGLSSAHLDAQRDRAAARVPDDAARRLGREHRNARRARSSPLRAGDPEPVALPVSSSQTRWRTIRPPSTRPSSPAAAAPYNMLTSPPFMSAVPRPTILPSRRADGTGAGSAPGRRRSDRGSRRSRGPRRWWHGRCTAPPACPSARAGSARRRGPAAPRVAEHGRAPSEPTTGRVLGVDGTSSSTSAAMSAARGSSQARMSSAWSIGEIATR